MTILNEPNHLTAGLCDRMARATFAGLGHFAGSGPVGWMCRECRHWDHHERDYHSQIGKFHGLIRSARCLKYRLLTNADGAKIPNDAASCRHVNEAETVPARFLTRSVA